MKIYFLCYKNCRKSAIVIAENEEEARKLAGKKFSGFLCELDTVVNEIRNDIKCIYHINW